MSKLIILLMLAVTGFPLFAQNGLTLDDAIQIALEQNLDIRISENTKQISENNAIPGNAGLLPEISANGSVDYGLDNIRIQVQESPDVIETNGAESWNYNANIALSYTIFSGMGNRNTFKQLKILSDIGEVQNLLSIENIVLQVASAYYNVLRTNDNIESLKETVAISERRYTTALNRKELSGGSSLDVLNAEVSLNQDSVNLLNAARAYKESVIELNRLLARDLSTPVSVDDNELDINKYDLLLLKEEMMDQNRSLMLARFNEKSSLMEYRIAKSAYYPRLSLNTTYSYNRLDAEGSFLVLNESNGLGVTLNLSVPIYSGGSRRAAAKNASLQLKNNELDKMNNELIIESDLMTAYSDYINTSQVVKMEEDNVEVAELNYQYSEDRFRNGQISNTDLREAQINLLLAKNNLNNQRYNLRLLELELLRLSGRLVRNE